MLKRAYIMYTIPAVLLCAGLAWGAGELSGRAKIGGVVLDEEGNPGVSQATYNVYEGVALSLEDFRYTMDNGVRIYGDLKNITMNNRNLNFGITKAGLFGVTARNNQYRRIYSLDGSQFTRRRQTNTEFWVQPYQYVKLFGGYGITSRHGNQVELFEPESSTPAVTNFDYTQTYYHAGLELKQGRRQLQFEYRGSSFSEDIASTSDRSSARVRVAGRAPLPVYENLVLMGGYQHYCYRVNDTEDTVKANTGWLGGALYYGDGWSLRYSFIWDRARRTGDLSATDNLTNAVYLGKTWRGLGGATIGYRHKINDDLLNEVKTDGYFFSGWLKPRTDLLLRAGYGSESKDVTDGHTLTGDADYTKHYASVRYDFLPGSQIQVKVTNRSTENDNIGSSYDYLRFATDVVFNYPAYGMVQFSWAYMNGNYESRDDKFEFRDHVLNGDFWSREYHKFTAGFGGTYVRSKQDLDIEKSSVRLSGRYTFLPRHTIELIYTAHNFDDLADPSPVYSRYYTANIVEINLIHEF